MACASDSIVHSSIELRKTNWVNEINELLNRDDLHTASESPASIFRLSDSIGNDKPEVYSPRRVALGPYHHFRPDLYKMELYKLEKAKKLREELQLHEFPQLGNELKLLELRIRACFDKFLEMDGDTLAWILLVDGLFLLGLLVAISENGEGGFGGLNFPLKNFDEEKFYPSLDRKILTQYEILSDALMLENQIPCLVLERIYSSELNRSLAVLLYDFYVAVSPFLGEVVVPSFVYSSSIEILQESHHLLHFMYLSILFIPEPPIESDECLVGASYLSSSIACRTPLSVFQICLNVLGFALNLPFIQLFKEAIDLILVLLELLKSVINPCFGQEVSPAIPSASELEKVKVKFQTSSNKILKVRFDEGSTTVFLPAISIDVLSEVLLRNLVAFEAESELNPPCLYQFISLMSGLIVTTKDVKILKKENIICSQLESDEEVVEFFNGIKNSTSSLKKNSRPKIHYVIKDSTNMSMEESSQPQIHHQDELVLIEENIHLSQSDEYIATLLNRTEESTFRSEGTIQPEMYYQHEIEIKSSNSLNDEELVPHLKKMKEDDIILTSVDYAKMNYQDDMILKSSQRQKTKIYEKFKEQDTLVFVEENIHRNQSLTDEETVKQSDLIWKETSQPELWYREAMTSKPANDEGIAAYRNKMKEDAITLTSTDYAKMNYQDEMIPKSSSRQKTEVYEKIKEDYEKGLKGIVDEIKKYYESCWRVKAKRLMKKYVSPVLVSVVILIIVFLIILVIVRLACSFVSCPKIIKSSVATNVISLADV